MTSDVGFDRGGFSINFCERGLYGLERNTWCFARIDSRTEGVRLNWDFGIFSAYVFTKIPL